MEHRRIYNYVLIIFLLTVIAFGLVRASHEYRWSGWGPGDAYSLAAAQHFADEGFSANYFLTYFHPGYPGSINPSPALYTWWWDGYYTHSPPLYAVINGVILNLGGGRYAAQAVSVVLSALALLFWYIFASCFFKRRVALISTIVIGLAVVFLEHMDGLSRQTYDVVIVFAALGLFAAVEQGRLWEQKRKLRITAFGAVWLLVLLQSLNSFEYIF